MDRLEVLEVDGNHVQNQDQETAQGQSQDRGQSQDQRLRVNMRGTLFFAVCVAVYAAASVGVSWIVSQNGMYPSGSDTMFHVYKGDFLFHAIQSGTWYPFYDPMWYNGVEAMRYWAPLPAYVMAACQWLAGGAPTSGYLVYVGLVCFAGAIGWLFIGFRAERRLLGAFIGLLWFFIPNNLLAMFGEGNLPRSLCMVFLPLIVYHVWSYLGTRNWKKLPLISLLFALAALCHSGYAGMIAIGLLLYFVVYGIVNRCWARQAPVIVALLLGYALIGIWLVPSLIGGITSGNSSEVMATFFQDAFTSLNPFDRFETYGNSWYFGLAAFVLAVFGCVFSRRRSLPGFWTAVVIFVCTTTSAYPVLLVLPGSQYLWMLRFISIALCFILMAFLMWGSLRKVITVLFCALLAVDALPSAYFFVYGSPNDLSVEQRYEQFADATLIEEAQNITEQRLALMDEGTLGATGAYLISDWGNPVRATFGAGREAATTATNIVQLNRSLDVGAFYYLFDRALELGNDSVLVSTRLVDEGKYSLTDLDNAANRLGYSLVDSSMTFRLYHLQDASGTWGTVSKYKAVGIGSTASSMSLSFPCMEETDSNNLNDYSFEDLKDYEVVYLSGITYSDQNAAEELIRHLSESGVRVVISADGIPENRDTHDRVFLGVRCNTIAFSNGYPELKTVDGNLNCDLFPQGFTWWQTVYLEGLDDVWGTIDEDGTEFDFYGTVENENIVMIGLNLTYHLSLTQDPTVEGLLTRAMDLQPGDLPERDIVSVSLMSDYDRIILSTNSNNVNTALSWHDVFSSESPIWSHNHLTFVDSGETVITMAYPYPLQGVAATGIGLIGLVILCLVTRHIERYRTPARKE